ncbi:jg5324 [Pararge aegeria aegeria]|uniref:Endoplasmic reticulum lectin 1 n=2 Tax=Pararge aegeria TaxID=116150 RepID=A0A8S4RBA0_9NEOP|nr:jg5324 [Pararge aegeria aegeria]
MKRVCLFVLCVAVCVWSIKHDLRGFDDSIIFKVTWPGSLDTPDKLVDEDGVKPEVKETLEVMTTLKEKYKCHLPELRANQTTTAEEYDGPLPINLLQPLFTQKICSYRLETYWSYEVCHGRYVRQYHEEREAKSVKTQEFFLGTWNEADQSKLEDSWKLAAESKETPKTTKVEGQLLPYVEMVMGSGTQCDLNDKARLTRVLYVCYNYGRHEIYSLKETATCEYEIIILSPLLCQHPQFKPKVVDENIISCLPLDDAPKKPRDLLKSEVESLKLHQQAIKLRNEDKESDDVLGVWKIEKVVKDGETHLKFELHPISDDETDVQDSSKQDTIAAEITPPVTDDSPVRALLNGEECMTGGTGWWKYEFCYGKYVMQYHAGNTGPVITVMLGKFDEQKHIDWIKENKGKAPKPHGKRTSVSHFYSGGDLCDKTGKPRQTEVKLRCPENSSNVAQVALYLLEPRTCHYILGVESPLICEILQHADKDGLIKPTPLSKPQGSSKEAKEEQTTEKDDNKLGLD